MDIYAPSESAAQKLPVFVYFYGGGMVIGSSRDIDPSRLARREHIIVVVPNYRLGVFGYLTLSELDAENHGTSGNYGLWDQNLALRWVNENIGSFGGDAHQVTIGGQSAGGYSVGVHLLWKESWPLFQRGILMGMPFVETRTIHDFPGYRTNDWEQQKGASALLPLLAACASSPDRLRCLRGRSTEDIARAVAAAPGLIWGPTIDGSMRTDLPPRMVARGEFKPTPLMFGVNQNEGGLAVLEELEALGRPMTTQDYRSNLLTQEDGQRILEHSASRQTEKPENSLAAVHTQMVNCLLPPAARGFSSGVPIFAYLFADENAPPLGRLGKELFGYRAGSYHASEIQYVFGSGYPQEEAPGPPPFSPNQLALSERMMDYWGEFIRTGRPADPSVWPDIRSSATILKLVPEKSDIQISESAFEQQFDCAFWHSLERYR